MGINILAFGQAIDIIGEANLEHFHANNTAELNRLLHKNFPLLQSIEYSIAVNKKIIQENTELHDGDTVAILPPFSGG